ncbi:class I adenylate-forming enzyme family protein [Microbacterium aurantiacum]|uniref:class I adenylate-forming enzyme family protein n=1 Tax=Microbacterium aurantiacum TaxID=162393 RepID=UPI001FEADE8E|nr:AMP-binding protein [Microbacterium aurantiacum]
MRRVATIDPDRVALVSADAHLTYAELDRDARRIAAFVDGCLPSSLAGASDPAEAPVVGICVRSAFTAARFVVGLEAGPSVLAVVDPQWPVALQVRMIQSARMRILITDAPGLPAALRSAGWGGVAIHPRDVDAHPTDDIARPENAETAPFLMLFSSGTTGDPKAFLKTRAQYRANLAVSREFLGADPEVATFAPGPLSYSLTLYALFEGLATGGRVHLADRLADLWLTTRAEREQVTRLVTVPSALHALADAARRAPGRFAALRLIVTGGASLSAGTRAIVARELPHARIISYYGAGELGFIGDSRDTGGTGIRLYPRVEASVRDDAGRPVRAGELGTLWVRSASCSDRYLAHTTRAVLSDAAGWATVHDQGFLEDRIFSFVGRRGDVVATGGHKVSLTEVEQVFDGMPGLGAACAIAQPHRRLGVVVGLVIEGDRPSKRALQRWAAERLPSASVPRRWYAVAGLPRTGGGKVRRDETLRLVSTERDVVRL